MAKTYASYGTFENVNAIQAFVDNLNEQERKLITAFLAFGSYKLSAAIAKGQTNPLKVDYKGDNAEKAKTDALTYVQSISDPKTPEKTVKQVQDWVKGDIGLEFMVAALLAQRESAKAANGKAAK